ncbi:MAG: histidine phosphatase family protein [Gammaproteobacteria bacterium]|nr:histidine phosphatase family protein [Gammaproteobacteria bacterium]
MKPKKIILIRHGQSEGNEDSSNYETIPDYALNLTDLGLSQAKEAGKTILKEIGTGTVQAYISPYYRTRQTYEGIASVLGDAIVGCNEDPRVREQDWGHLRHPDDSRILREERNKYSLFYYRMKDGESGADVYDRVSGFFETMYRDFKKERFPENVLIVTHGMTLRIFLMRWLHWTVEEYEALDNPGNCQVVVMEQNEDGKYQLTSPLKLR